MNFFGHAALAARHFGAQRPEPSSQMLAALCAGSMLPDFVGMLRLGRPLVSDAHLGMGVRFHHQTDAAFHDLPGFVHLSRDAFAWLSARGVARGPSRAVAHMGVEMLLDEALANDALARDAYCEALRLPLLERLSFESTGDGERLASLQRALLERAESTGARLASVDIVAERIVRSLAGRPRLALAAADRGALAAWVAESRPLVHAEAPAIFAALRARLANFSGAE